MPRWSDFDDEEISNDFNDLGHVPMSGKDNENEELEIIILDFVSEDIVILEPIELIEETLIEKPSLEPTGDLEFEIIEQAIKPKDRCSIEGCWAQLKRPSVDVFCFFHSVYGGK